MIKAALAGHEVMGFKINLEVLGQERVKYWTNRAYALMAQVKKLVLDEAIRWDQGAFNSGVAISTDTRSQSKRKMSLNEFKRYLTRKLQPIIEPVAQEFMEEAQRAQMTSSNTTQSALVPSKPGLSPEQIKHLREVKELNEYISHYEEEYKKWWMGLKQKSRPVWDRLILPSSTVIRGKIGYPNGYIAQAQARKTQLINLFGTKVIKDIRRAKAEIEFNWKGVIPLCESELKKLDPNYEYSAAPIPDAMKRPLLPYGAGLGALGSSPKITVPVRHQRNLAGADKLRGQGRPVLSEQQGTQGLAGLFPALRSSMQGALRQ